MVGFFKKFLRSWNREWKISVVVKFWANMALPVGCEKHKRAENAKKTTCTGPFRRLPRAGLWSKLDFFGPKWQTRLDEALGWSIMPIGWWVGRPDLIQWQFPKILLRFAKFGPRLGPPMEPRLRFLKFFGFVGSVFGKWTCDNFFGNFGQPWCCLEAFKPKSHLPGSPRLIKSKSI